MHFTRHIYEVKQKEAGKTFIGEKVFPASYTCFKMNSY